MGEVLERLRAKLDAGIPVSAIELAKTRRKEVDDGQLPYTDKRDIYAIESVRPLHVDHYTVRSREELRADEERRAKLREQWRQDDLRLELKRERARRDPEDLRRFVKYKLEPHEYRQLVVQQNGACAICKEPGRKLCVDHHHETGRVRALLCGHCNSAIGFLRESPLLARAAATYLEQYNKHQPQIKTYLEQQLMKEFTGE